jgi:hypothetical protein
MREDKVGKLFVTVFTNGDLLTNPMSLRECVVCGEVFDRPAAMLHADISCPPSPQQPLATAGRYR